MEKYCERSSWPSPRIKLVIDIEKDYYEMLKYSVEHGQDYKTFEIIANGIPYDDLEERPQVKHKSECEDCDYRKFTKQFIDGVVDVMTKNGISSYEELIARLNIIANAQPASDRYDEGYAQGYIGGSTGADWEGGAK